MSYIIKKSSPLVNLKLTDKGRRNLANGALTFSKFGLGDSEVDYLTHDSSITDILRPVDNQPDIMYPVASEGFNYLMPITNLNSIPREIRQPATERGMFMGATLRELRSSVILDDYQVTNVTGSTCTLTSTGTTFPMVNDVVLIKSGYGSTSGSSRAFEKAETVLQFYVQTVVTGTTNSVTVQLDRPLPKFNYTNVKAHAYSNNLVQTLDYPDPSTYWSDAVLGFDENGSTTYDDVPVWNFNLVLIEDMMGVDPTVDKYKGQTKGKRLLGTSVLFKQYAEAKLDKIGVVHYTNNTVSNWYAEGFYRDTFKLELPHIMWGKKQMGGTSKSEGLGYTFVCDKELKVIEGKIRYYDLVDQEARKTVVGKVYVDYKIAIIEDAELLMAMSVKGNRNWTLPTPKLTLTEPGTCLASSGYGSVRSGESLHIAYIMYDTNGVTPVHCNNFSTVTIENGVNTVARDVIFEFPKDPNDPLYSELGYLRDYTATGTTTGFKVNRIAMLWQKTDAGERPNPSDWKIKDITNYLGTNGCLNQNVEVVDEFYLETDSILNPVDVYTLEHPAIGDIILASEGLVKVEAATQGAVSANEPYYFDKATNKVYFHDSVEGKAMQIYYLSGDTNTTSTRTQKYIWGTNLTSQSIPLQYQPSNNVVYVFYNGMLISSNNYAVLDVGQPATRRVELLFTPAAASTIVLYYVDSAGTGINPLPTNLTAANFQNLRVFIDKDFLDNSQHDVYNLRDFITLPALGSTQSTFGDEDALLGNVKTDIKATVFKSVMVCNVLPNKFVTSSNPTWNVNQDKVQFSEIGIYDEDNDLVAIGKFSQPLKRKLNSDILVIQATIDF